MATGTIGLVLTSAFSPGDAGAQALPSSQPVTVSGATLVSSGGRLYFGSPERAYEHDPAALSASGRGLTRPFTPVSEDWLAFLRTRGNAILPISGGTRAGRTCYRGLRRYDPSGEAILFATRECLLPEEFPAVLLGADEFHVLGERLYYTHEDRLYVSDGTAAGNQRLGTLGPARVPLTRLDDRIVYTAGDYYSSFYELVPTAVAGRSIGFSDAHIEGRIVPLGSVFYGKGTVARSGAELWRFDPATRRADLVTDLKPGVDGSHPGELTLFRGAVYLHADGPAGNELYRLDAQGLQLVRDIHPSGSALPRALTVVGDRLYFRADDGQRGEELWETDGTEAGTRLVGDIATGRPGSHPHGLVALDGLLYFWADDGVWGESLWRLRAQTLELVETTTLVETLARADTLDDWPPRYDTRAIRDPDGDVGPGNLVDLRSVKLGWSGRALVVGYELAAPLPEHELTRLHLFFDVDRRANTGMRVDGGQKTPFGADYMIEGLTLFRYRGDTAWDWEPVSAARWWNRPPFTAVELSFESAVQGTGIIGSKVIAWGANSTQDDYATRAD